MQSNQQEMRAYCPIYIYCEWWSNFIFKEKLKCRPPLWNIRSGLQALSLRKKCILINKTSSRTSCEKTFFHTHTARNKNLFRCWKLEEKIKATWANTVGLKDEGLKTEGSKTDGLKTENLITEGLKTEGLKAQRLKTQGLKALRLKWSILSYQTPWWT